jgi:hypothetical protein
LGGYEMKKIFIYGYIVLCLAFCSYQFNKAGTTNSNTGSNEVKNIETNLPDLQTLPQLYIA